MSPGKHSLEDGDEEDAMLKRFKRENDSSFEEDSEDSSEEWEPLAKVRTSPAD